MATYTKAFPGQTITFVDRNRLQENINEQDLLQWKLNEKTRAKIKLLFGVEALIMCTYYDGSDGIGVKKLRIRIVDSDTGAIVGSVITEGRDNFSFHCETAVKALKADLLRGSWSPVCLITRRGIAAICLLCGRQLSKMQYSWSQHGQPQGFVKNWI